MTKPIKPSEVVALKTTAVIPGEVFAAFNEAIARHWDGKVSTFTQDEVVEAIRARIPLTERAWIYQNKWLDVEPSYRAEGWVVEYDKPVFDESYKATFTFRKAAP